jgi:hypothetical protein
MLLSIGDKVGLRIHASFNSTVPSSRFLFIHFMMLPNSLRSNQVIYLSLSCSKNDFLGVPSFPFPIPVCYDFDVVVILLVSVLHGIKPPKTAAGISFVRMD